MNGLPERLRNMGLDTCEWAADEIERLRAVEQAILSASSDDADTIADLEARLETSMEVICAREQHVESQRIEIGRLRQELTEAMHYGAELAQERDEAREAIRRWRDLTLVMGSHRTCCCNACEALRQEVSDE